MLNQQIMTGIALYEPIATRKRAAYWSLLLLWTEMRMPKPVMAMQIGIMVNAKRCFVKSEKVAMTMAKAKAQAQGGTLCSWVSIGEYLTG